MKSEIATGILQSVLSADHTGLRPVFDGTTGMVTRWVPVRDWDEHDQVCEGECRALWRKPRSSYGKKSNRA